MKIFEESTRIMNEDFVTYELAKKLREKGFRELCLTYYTNDDTLYYNYSHKAGACYKDCYLSHNLMPKDSVSGKFVDAPTIPQVLKYLREEKKLHLMIDIWKVDINDTTYKWGYDIVNLTTTHVEGCDTLCANSYEQAALAGIEYVLDKLI